jgi:hypothetical protein
MTSRALTLALLLAAPALAQPAAPSLRRATVVIDQAAIRAATGRGIHVIEAAGNGGMDLDDARYGRRFDRTFRDSGAIVVGASDSNRDPARFTDFGSDPAQLTVGTNAGRYQIRQGSRAIADFAGNEVEAQAALRRMLKYGFTQRCVFERTAQQKVYWRR